MARPMVPFPLAFDSARSVLAVKGHASVSVRVSGNWRIVFRFADGEAVDVDLIDYH